MAVSAIRCTLTYIVLPFVMPLVGITAGLDAKFGLALGAIAIMANLVSVHRFWSADHRYKMQAIMANVAMIIGLSMLFIGDLRGVLSEM